jgi:hypothetical protein
MALLLGLPALAQVTGGDESVQDAIRFERQKDAAAARQARIENRRGSNSSADRQDNTGAAKTRTGMKKGSAARTNTTKPQQ